jgi:hypothetical protein
MSAAALHASERLQRGAEQRLETPGSSRVKRPGDRRGARARSLAQKLKQGTDSAWRSRIYLPFSSRHGRLTKGDGRFELGSQEFGLLLSGPQTRRSYR